MVDTLTWVLAGVLVYMVGTALLGRYGYLPGSIHVSGPITTIHTERGKALLDRLGRHRRFFRAWANVGVGFGLVVMVGMFLVVVFSGLASFSQPDANPIQEPTNALVIPGLNDFLPLAAAPEIVFGLAVGMIVHEGGHGLLCRVEGIDIDSMGLALFTLVPIGAFVQPDEESQRAADRGARTRMFAAGVTNNFALTVVALVVLFGPVAGSITAVSGVAVGGVLPGSPADGVGIERGDVIVGVNGTTVTNQSTFSAALGSADGRTVEVSLESGSTRRIERSVFVTSAIEDGPLSVASGQTIERVNETVVHTVTEFYAAVDERPIATLQTTNGTETTGPVGAYVSAVVPDEPLAAAGAPAGEPVVITRFAGQRIVTGSDLSTALDRTTPGQRVQLEAVVDGRVKPYTVTLGEHPRRNIGFLGVAGVQPGVSGVVLSDFGIQPYPAEFYLSLLGGSGPDLGLSLPQRLYSIVTLPVAAVASPVVPFNFAGFLGPLTSFYAVGGPLGFLGGGVFVAANVLFWTAWINLNVAVFNLIPLFPLDGGHILRTSAEAIVARTPLDTRWVVRAVTVSIGLLMFASLAVMLLGPALLP
ncbi:MAG: site-2 protease family protein [Halorhabdus sp.]